MKAIQKLLDECKRASIDVYGFLHYIPKEAYEDAQREYDTLSQEQKRKIDYPSKSIS